ncbi:AaceriAEL129Cp [[Ashbya] aceris (nom. inval.)]|nr:AaceriAEL129Cp [[Ashbya] aceris (nom. inval.)]
MGQGNFPDDPYAEEAQPYLCNCIGCCHLQKYRTCFVRLFVTGFVFPVCWLLNILLYLYLCWWIPHEVVCPGVLPPSSMQDSDNSADCTIATKEVPDRPSSDEPWDTSTVRDLPLDGNINCTPSGCAGGATAPAQLLTTIAASAIACHYQCRCTYLKWFARSLVCVIGYGAMAVALVAVLSSRKAVASASGNKFLAAP